MGTKKHKVKHCIQTCGACPSQWDIYTDEGEHIYARYRWGVLTLTLDPFGDEGKLQYKEQYGKPLDGYMTTKELMERTKSVLDWCGSRIFER